MHMAVHKRIMQLGILGHFKARAIINGEFNNTLIFIYTYCVFTKVQYDFTIIFSVFRHKRS